MGRMVLSTHSVWPVVFAPLTFIEKLWTLTPPPRQNLVTHHGVFAPNTALRDAPTPSALPDFVAPLPKKKRKKTILPEEDTEEAWIEGGAGHEPFDNTVYGLVWDVPVVKSVSFEGEWNRTKSRNRVGRSTELEGYGGTFSLIANYEKKFMVDAAYIYLSPNWDSFFRALSYSSNRRGTRIRLEYSEKRYLIALFTKYLSTIGPVDDPVSGTSATLAYPTFSLRGYFKINPDLNLGLTAIYAGEGPEENGFTLDTDNKRITWLATLSYEFGRGARLNLEERYIQHKFALEDNYNVSILSLYLRAQIW